MTDDIETVDNLDTHKFMGDWYVIAHIPPFLTDDAYNAVERYRMNDDGTVDVLFTYREGSFDGKSKSMTPKGFPEDGKTDADGAWGMRIIWPFKGDYRVSHIDSGYTQTIIAREKRDYLWIMARSPIIDPSDYDALVARVEALGYNVADLRQVPQQPAHIREEPEEARNF